MIYDCFIFNNELDLLEIRLNELSKCIQPVTHILIESKWTFTGREKPLCFASNASKYEDFPILSISIENMPDTNDPWSRERFQRNAIGNALKLMCPSDRSTIIVSDADEIPNATAVDGFYKRNTEFAALIMDKYSYYLNYVESYQEWDRARIMKYSYFKNKTADEVRNSGFDNEIFFGGWHFSWLHDKAKDKLKSFSHTEFDNAANEYLIEQRMNFWNDKQMNVAPIMDNTHPEFIVTNMDKFKHLIK